MEHRQETGTLISADKVAGTDVYNREGTHLGEVHDVMLDKLSGSHEPDGIHLIKPEMRIRQSTAPLQHNGHDAA